MSIHDDETAIVHAPPLAPVVLVVTNDSRLTISVREALRNEGIPTFSSWMRALIVSLLVATGCTFAPPMETADSGGGGGGGGGDGGSDARSGAEPITFDAASNGATGSGSQKLMWTHTTEANLSDSLLIVGVSIEKQSGATVATVTYDAQPMMRAAFEVGGDGVRAEMWFLKSPAAGSNQVVVTFTAMLSGDGAVGGGISLSGVDQTMPIQQTMVGGGNGQPSTTITTQLDGSWAIDTVTVDNGSAVTSGSNQTQRWNATPPKQGITGAGSTVATTTPGAEDMTWSIHSDNWAQVVVEVARDP